MHSICFSLFLFLFQQPVVDPDAPTLVSIEPSSMVQGRTATVTLKGSGLVPRSMPEMPADIGNLASALLGPVQYIDDNTMEVSWRLPAPAGKYYVNIRTSPSFVPYVPERRSNLLPFTILSAAIPSTRQYEVTTFAGMPGGPGAADGRGGAARFRGLAGGIWGDEKFLYVSDNHTIRRIEIATRMVTSIAGTPYIRNYADGKGREARFNNPGPIWGDGTSLYVLEFGPSSTIRKIALDTGEVTTVGQRGYTTTATNMSGFGRHLYFSQGRTIYAVDPETGQSVFSRSLEDVDGSLRYGNRPIPLWSDEHAVYIVDNGSNDPQKPRSLIRRIDFATLEITTIAGSDSQIGFADGPGMFARFNHPSGLWGDGTHLFVVDADNRAIRKIDLRTQQVSTLAGFPEPRLFPDANHAIVDGPGSLARFSIIGRIWGDGTYLYVTDLFVVRRVTIATGEVVTIAGSPWNPGADDGIGAAARFVNAGSIHGNKNTLYVQDGLRGALRSVDLATAEVRTVGYMAAAIFQAIWTDETNIYTTDPSTGVIQRLEINTGTIRPLARLPNLGPAPTFHYRSMWGDGANLYVGGNKKIYKVVIATGEVSVLAGKGLVTGSNDEFLPKDGIGTAAQLISPTGLWGDGTILYVADTWLIRKVVLSTGEVTTIAGGNAGGIHDGVDGDAAFADLRGIWGDGRYLYVIESNSNRVRRISIDSREVTTIAGEFAFRGTEDGHGSLARFGSPGGIWGDGTNIYVSEGTVIRKLSPIPEPASARNFAISANSLMAITTRGAAEQVTVGYAHVKSDTPTAMAGTAFFGYRQNGVLVTEAGVPATRPIRQGRIHTASGQFVRTGVAMSNPTPQPVTVSFHYTDENGVDFGAGTTIIPARGQISRFLDEDPFTTTPVGRSRSFTFNASGPIGVIALRGFTNQRSEFLITTLPVTDLAATKAGIAFPHFVKGGGWTTNITLVNPSDSLIEGDIVVLLGDGTVDTKHAYALAPRSAFTVMLTDASATTRIGQVRVNPKSGHAVPDGVLVLSFQRDGITVTETSIPGVQPSAVLRTYVETAADLQTGIALANGGSAETTVALSLLSAAGEDLALRTTLTLPANGHIALFLREIPGFASLPSEFRGVLRVGSAAPISAVALRGRHNERRDFILSTTQVVAESVAAASEFIFPHFVDGAGYTTEFVLFSASSEPATGTIEFRSQSGAPLTLQLR